VAAAVGSVEVAVVAVAAGAVEGAAAVGARVASVPAAGWRQRPSRGYRCRRRNRTTAQGKVNMQQRH
jgi:hypothetical protein